MFKLSVKDLSGDMTSIMTSSLEYAKTELSLKYSKDAGCILLFDLSTGNEITDEVIDKDVECGVFVNSYSKKDKEVFEKFSYPHNGDTIFFFDVYMDVFYNPNSIEKELFVIIHKLPELFDWIQDRNVTHFTFETYHVTQEWHQDIQTIGPIFDTLIQCLADNTTLKHVNLSIFYYYLFTHPEQREKMQEMLNSHPYLDKIYMTRHDQRNDKVIKLIKNQPLTHGFL